MGSPHPTLVQPEISTCGLDVTSFPELRVLAVDDSTLDRRLVERLLQRQSYKVTCANSAYRALELLGLSNDSSIGHQFSPPFHLIISDFHMPGMSGEELLKRVKEASNLQAVPMVIMSSENISENVTRCLEKGAEDFLLKPVQETDIERISSMVKQSVCGHHLSLQSPVSEIVTPAPGRPPMRSSSLKAKSLEEATRKQSAVSLCVKPQKRTASSSSSAELEDDHEADVLEVTRKKARLMCTEQTHPLLQSTLPDQQVEDLRGNQ